MVRQFKFVIIGAGPTGIGAALRLLELGERDFVILESANHVGGLSASFLDNAGFTWDLGSHLQHSHYAKFDEYMDIALEPSEWLKHKRSTWIWHGDRFVPYPFQLNLHHLSREEQWRCVHGLLTASSSATDSSSDFGSWIRGTFGQGIAELFMIPYNEKIWARSVDELSCTWIADRVATPRIEDVLRSICLHCDNTAWGPNAEFRYPRRGGTGRIWRELCARFLRHAILVGQTATGINRHRKIVECNSHPTYQYEYLISTLPLDCLARITHPNEDLHAASYLARNTTHVVGLGITGRAPNALAGHCWDYFAQPSIPFYRVAVMSNFSPENTPDPQSTWSLMAEVSESKRTSQPDDLIASVERGLRNVGMIDESAKIVSRWHRNLLHGYPVPTLERDRHLATLLNILESDRIYSRGRFGAWKYEVSNQDHSFMQGVEVIDRVLFGHCEFTLNHPQLVNSRYNRFPYSEWRSSARDSGLEGLRANTDQVVPVVE